MNGRHLPTFVWLRWKLMSNGWRRAGTLNFVVTLMLAVAALVAALPLSIGSFFVGCYVLAETSPERLLYVWDLLAVSFTFLWCVGLLAELQRTEALSLGKFMHLPVSLQGAFVINYLSTLFGLTTFLFGAIVLGLAIGLAASKSLWLLSALPLSAALLLMVSAASYQFQGWLASLMSNPRRRRAVLVGATALFVMLSQLPNLLNSFAPWSGHTRRFADQAKRLEALQRDFQAGKFDVEELQRRQTELIEGDQREGERAMRSGLAQWERGIRLLNWIVPIGWLPLGVMGAARGNLAFPALAFTAMTLLGSGCLWRAYRTTLRIYQGSYTKGAARPKAKAPSPTVATAVARSGRQMLEWRLPGLSEPVAAIALAGLQSLLRSPEAKMMLLTPFIMSVVVGGALARQPSALPALARPFLAIGAIVMVLFGMVQLMANQFGFDRDGFRVFVLCAASRRDILLGKNLAFLPLAGGLAAMLMVVVEAVFRLRFDHLLAMLPQFVSMYLLFCLLANLLSIYAPMAIAAGSLKPVNQKIVPVLLQLVTILIFFPLIQLPTLLPLGAEAVLEHFGLTHGLPVFLPLALLECVAIVFLYRWILRWQGRLLATRERTILAAVVKAG